MRAMRARAECGAMILPVNPAKVLRLFAPLWALLALSLWINWSAWASRPISLAAIAVLPIGAALISGLMRERWRLELTPGALTHQTLGRRETFEWHRMGALQLQPAPISHLFFVRTFFFAFPLDRAETLEEHASRLTGRRILCVFGDQSAVETIRQIEAWRALYARSER